MSSGLPALLDSTCDHTRAGILRMRVPQHEAVANNVLGALARVGLARALTLAGDTTSASAQYESFFELWRNADADTPVMPQARAEYRAISQMARRSLPNCTTIFPSHVYSAP